MAMTIDERIKEAKKKRTEAYKKDSVQGIVYWDGYLDGLKAVQRDVTAGYLKDYAREIFEEIEAEIELALESNYRAKKEHYNRSVIPNYDHFNAMCDGKIYAMRGLLDFMEELKKKYTEGAPTK